MAIYKSYLLTPTGQVVKNINYYEFEDIARQIVDLSLRENPNLKLNFDEFKKNYTHYSPYIDYLICKLNYQFINPFVTEEGCLCSKGNRLFYVQYALDDKFRTITEYPKASDKDLHISHVSIDSIDNSIIDPNGICYTLDRKKDEVHQQYYETILMHKMINNKMLYEDYVKCSSEYSDTYYLINTYFRDRLGYLQVVKYLGDSGYVLYNEQLKESYINNLLSSINDFYPNMSLEKSILPDELIESSIEIKNEMSDIYEGRRI